MSVASRYEKYRAEKVGNKMKLEKIKVLPNETGYKLGEWYLLKHYTWGNKYNWFIAKELYVAIMSCEIGKLLDENKIEFVSSFKEGKQKLEEIIKD